MRRHATAHLLWRRPKAPPLSKRFPAPTSRSLKNFPPRRKSRFDSLLDHEALSGRSPGAEFFRREGKAAGALADSFGCGSLARRRADGLRGAERNPPRPRHPLVRLRLRRKTDPSRSRACRTATSATPKAATPARRSVERVRSRGQVNRQRVRLAFSGDVVPTGYAPHSGRQRSRPRHACRADLGPNAHPRNGLRPQEANAPGTVLQCAGGTATIVK